MNMAAGSGLNNINTSMAQTYTTHRYKCKRSYHPLSGPPPSSQASHMGSEGELGPLRTLYISEHTVRVDLALERGEEPAPRACRQGRRPKTGRRYQAATPTIDSEALAKGRVHVTFVPRGRHMSSQERTNPPLKKCHNPARTPIAQAYLLKKAPMAVVIGIAREPSTMPSSRQPKPTAAATTTARITRFIM